MVVVNEAFAKKFNLGRDAVGKHMNNDGPNNPLNREIVGLVANAKYSEVKRDVPPQFFMLSPGRPDRFQHVLRAHRRGSHGADAVHHQGGGTTRLEAAD